MNSFPLALFLLFLFSLALLSSSLLLLSSRFQLRSFLKSLFLFLLVFFLLKFLGFFLVKVSLVFSLPFLLLERLKLGSSLLCCFLSSLLSSPEVTKWRKKSFDCLLTNHSLCQRYGYQHIFLFLLSNSINSFMVISKYFLGLFWFPHRTKLFYMALCISLPVACQTQS